MKGILQSNLHSNLTVSCDDDWRNEDIAQNNIVESIFLITFNPGLTFLKLLFVQLILLPLMFCAVFVCELLLKVTKTGCLLCE